MRHRKVNQTRKKREKTTVDQNGLQTLASVVTVPSHLTMLAAVLIEPV
jgi:hypothetical protein